MKNVDSIKILGAICLSLLFANLLFANTQSPPVHQIGPVSKGTNIVVRSYDDRPVNRYISEACIDGFVYLLTDSGGITPKIKQPSSDAFGHTFGHTGSYVACEQRR